MDVFCFFRYGVKFEPSSLLSSSGREFIKNCLEKDSEKRWTIDEALSSYWIQSPSTDQTIETKRISDAKFYFDAIRVKKMIENVYYNHRCVFVFLKI